MAGKFKFICSGYNCSEKAKYIREIDGRKLYFCETHKHCLDHSRSEMVCGMISTSRMTPQDLLSRFDFIKAGFPVNILKETLRVLTEGRHICLKDNILRLYKHKNICIFPSCQYAKTNGQYCSLHSDLPGGDVIDKCLEISKNRLMTADQIASEVNITTQAARSLLIKLYNAGAMESTKVGRTCYYSTI